MSETNNLVSFEVFFKPLNMSSAWDSKEDLHETDRCIEDDGVLPDDTTYPLGPRRCLF